MMSLKHMEPYRSDLLGVNCITASINAVMHYEGYPNASLLWKQCGLKYIKNNDAIVGKLEPYFLNPKEELKWISNIQLVEKSFDTFEGLKHAVSKLIAEKKIPIAMVDPYYMPYSIHYQRSHYNHAVRIAAIDEQSVLVIDDSYSHKGDIPLNILKEGTDYSYGWPTKVHVQNKLLYIDDGGTSPDYEMFKEVIELNINELKPRESVGYPLTIVGINSIHEFIKDCILLKNSGTLCRDSFVSLYLMLSNVSNTRYLFGDFLRSFEQDYDTRALFEMYHSVAQEWKVASNIMLKGVYARHEEMFQRMVKKMDHVYTCEKMALQQLISFHSTLGD